MAIPIGELKGLTPELVAKFKAQGIRDGDQLLDAAKTPAGRKELATKLGMESRAILELANRADLARVKGIGGVFSDLLERAGVDTVKELAARRPDSLHAKLLEVNAQQKLAGRAPTLDAVTGWVAQAQALPKLLEY